MCCSALSQTHTHTQTHTPTFAHTHTHAHMPTQIHTHMHTHTHTHSLTPRPSSPPPHATPLCPRAPARAPPPRQEALQCRSFATRREAASVLMLLQRSHGRLVNWFSRTGVR